MNSGIEIILTNLGIALPELVLYVLLVGGLIFAVLDFKLMIITDFILCGLVFVWMYQSGLNYTRPLILMFIFFVIMALTLYSVNKTSSKGAFI